MIGVCNVSQDQPFCMKLSVENVKSFHRFFCLAILQYFVKFIFENYDKQQHFGVLIFLQKLAKSNTTKISSHKNQFPYGICFGKFLIFLVSWLKTVQIIENKKQKPYNFFCP